MPLLSSFLLIQSAAMGLIGLAILLVTSPATVLTSTTLSILGSSMHIRPATFIPDPFSRPSTFLQGQTSNPLTSLARSTKTTSTTSERELISLLGLVIGASALSTVILAFPLRFSKKSLTSRSTDDGKILRKSSAEVGEGIASLNLTQNVWQIFAGLHVVFAAAGVAWMYVFRGSKAIPHTSALAYSLDSASLIANNVTFTFCFCDMLFWGYLYTTIKEERREVLQVREKRRLEDEEDAANTTT